MMNSQEVLNLVARMRYAAGRLASEQYNNGCYSRSGGSRAVNDFNHFASELEQLALDLVRKEAVEDALAQLPLGQTVVIKL